MRTAQITPFLHAATDTFSYVVWDAATKAAAIIDPVLDYDHAAGRTADEFARTLVDYVRGAGLETRWILETHAHADHLSAAQIIKQELGGEVGIGSGIRGVQEHFRAVFNLADTAPDASHFDRLFSDGDRLELGDLEIQVLSTPGHTGDSVSYLIGDAIFVGDTLFAPDLGSARADFPGADAATLYKSIQHILALPESTRVFLCHDYPSGGRDHEYAHTVGEHRRSNVHVHDGMDLETYVALRQERDAALAVPALLIPSVQVNIRAGHLPDPEDNGVRYLKVPINRLGRGT